MAESITLDSDQMKDLVKDVSLRANVMKARQLLEASISKLVRENSYVQDRLTVAKSELSKVSQELNEIQTSLKAPQTQLNELTFEKETIQKNFASEVLMEQEIKVKSKQLSDLKIKINQIEEEVAILSITEKEYQSQHQVLVQVNNQQNSDIDNIQKQTLSLSSEIHSKKRILELLEEILAKHSDEDLDTQSIVQKFLDETRAEIDNITKNIDQSLQKIGSIQKELPDVKYEKDRLENQVNAAVSQIGDSYNIANLKKTLQSNKQKEAALIKENESKYQEIRKFETEIAALEKQISKERETESRLTRRYEYLLLQQKEMGSIEDPEKEIQRLKQSSKDLQLEIEISQSILDVSGDVRKELSGMQDVITKNISFYDGELDSLKDALAKLLL